MDPQGSRAAWQGTVDDTRRPQEHPIGTPSPRIAALLAAAATLSASCSAEPTATTGSVAAEAPAAGGEVADALAVLATLPVKGRSPKTGYHREQFGEAWTDDVRVAGGHNGCDTRNDTLRRDLTEVVTKDGTRDCKVLTGLLFDEYTGDTHSFVSGPGTSSLVQIDHVVALSNAWQTGAQQLDEATRADLANDPRNLQSVDGGVNQEKGDGDAATWLPPRDAYRCTYVARQVEVKAAYGLWVTTAERDAIERILTRCDTGDSDEHPPSAADDAPPTAHGGPAPYYVTCAAARSAGAAPLRAGSPGYRTGLDGDGDGVACEPSTG